MDLLYSFIVLICRKDQKTLFRSCFCCCFVRRYPFALTRSILLLLLFIIIIITTLFTHGILIRI